MFIPLNGGQMPGWFHLPPNYKGGRIPVVISFPGMDTYKEVFVALKGDRWLERGIAVLALLAVATMALYAMRNDHSRDTISVPAQDPARTAPRHTGARVVAPHDAGADAAVLARGAAVTTAYYLRAPSDNAVQRPRIV